MQNDQSSHNPSRSAQKKIPTETHSRSTSFQGMWMCRRHEQGNGLCEDVFEQLIGHKGRRRSGGSRKERNEFDSLLHDVAADSD